MTPISRKYVTTWLRVNLKIISWAVEESLSILWGCLQIVLGAIIFVPLFWVILKLVRLFMAPSKLPMTEDQVESSRLIHLVDLVPDSEKVDTKWISENGIHGERCGIKLQNHEVNVCLLKRQIPVMVTYQFKDGPSARQLHLPNQVRVYQTLEIRIRVTQKFWFRMTLQGVHEQNETEIQSGIDWLDRKYLIHTNQRTAGEQFLAELSNTLHFSSWRCTFDKLEIIEGEICLTFNQPGRWGMASSDMNRILEEITMLASKYERSELVVLHSLITPSSSLCPYCRGLFEENAQSIVACEKCSTRLHESCWKENGVCTTWGCGSVTLVNSRLLHNTFADTPGAS